MEPSFWENRWQDNNIGFHQGAVNTQLQACWEQLDIAAATRVFVPLAGKSLDILWLMERHPVVAVELSAIAVEDFFRENELRCENHFQGSLSLSTTDRLDFYQGDMLRLPDSVLNSCGAVYDRAALVALPPPLRERYVHKMTNALPAGVNMLLITIEYDEAAYNGPPFSIGREEVERLYAQDFRVRELHAQEEDFKGMRVTNRCYQLHSVE